jgi:TIR domain
MQHRLNTRAWITAMTTRRRSQSKPEKQSPSINIFISYAKEDRELVASIDSLLKDTFEFAPLNIYRDVEIKEGQNWVKQIDVALQDADILLVIFTERMKMSHSYTGYEIGYFNRSIQQRRKGSAGFERIYIPFCIGADVPDTMHDIQGISIGADEVYKVLKTKIESGGEPAVDEDHPVFKLLARISDLVMQTLGTGNGRTSRSARIAKQASALYRVIHEYLQGRVSSETYPERKLIIRTSTRPAFGRDGGVDLTKSNVELIGDYADIFNISTTQTIGREYTWSELCEKIPSELRANCVAGIEQLAAAVLKGGGDNYHVVTTVPRDKSFRLFVSKVVTYVSQKTEIHIYVVQMRTKDYGDPQSTRLLKAISVGLRFRSLVLEDESQFRPEKLGHPVVTAADLKAKVSEMLGQMDLILREAVEADLSDPALLILIWGKGHEQKVQDMIDLWEETRKRLYATADEVLSAGDDEGFRCKKQDFIKALQAFGEGIETMNREYTARVLTLLRDYVERKISLRQNDEKSGAAAVRPDAAGDEPPKISAIRPLGAPALRGGRE